MAREWAAGLWVPGTVDSSVSATTQVMVPTPQRPRWAKYTHLITKSQTGSKVLLPPPAMRNQAREVSFLSTVSQLTAEPEVKGKCARASSLSPGPSTACQE